MNQHNRWQSFCPGSETVAECGEDTLVSQICAMCAKTCTPDTGIIYGPGDDAAQCLPPPGMPLLTTMDSLVCNRHFTLEDNPERVGRKALAVNISDIAAMGGSPWYATISLALPSITPVAFVTQLFTGMTHIANEYSCALVGGDVVGAKELVISIALIGTAPYDAIRRNGAQKNNVIAVTGALGGSLESGRHLDVTPRIRAAHWLCKNARPTAMMDISDGIAMDAARLAVASNVSLHITKKYLPIHAGCSLDNALYDGEDFELLCTFAQKTFTDEMQKKCEKETGTPLTRIGTVGAPPASVFIDDTRLEPYGFNHFNSDPE